LVPITPPLSLEYHATEGEAIDQAAFHAFFAAAVLYARLKKRFEKEVDEFKRAPITPPSIDSSTEIWKRHLLPTITIVDEEPVGKVPKKLQFCITGEAESIANRFLYNCMLPEGNIKALVKYMIKHYSVDLHRFLASKGAAPKLYGYRCVGGDYHVVVMQDLRQDGYISLFEFAKERSKKIPKSVETEVTTVMREMHKGGFVHGDLRETNIMVKINNDNRNVQVAFIDFDWGGLINEATYPNADLHRDIKRQDPDDIKRRIGREDDEQTVRAMFEKFEFTD
jgi:hypothetical protein